MQRAVTEHDQIEQAEVARRGQQGFRRRGDPQAPYLLEGDRPRMAAHQQAVASRSRSRPVHGGEHRPTVRQRGHHQPRRTVAVRWQNAPPGGRQPCQAASSSTSGTTANGRSSSPASSSGRTGDHGDDTGGAGGGGGVDSSDTGCGGGVDSSDTGCGGRYGGDTSGPGASAR